MIRDARPEPPAGTASSERWLRSILLPYGTAILAVSLAAAIRYQLQDLFDSDLVYITFYLAVAIVAVVAGWGPGMVATAASAVTIHYLVLQPTSSLATKGTAATASLVLFSVMGVAISGLAGIMRRLQTKTARARETQMLESMREAFFALDKEERFTAVNAAMERSLDRWREELLGKRIWDCFPEGVGSLFHLALRVAMSEGTPVHDELYYAPRKVWYDVQAYPSAEGLIVHFRDVTDRKLAIMALAESEQRLAAAIGVGSCPIGGFDRASVHRVLGIDETKHEVALILCLGYRAQPQPLKRRLPLAELVEYR